MSFRLLEASTFEVTIQFEEIGSPFWKRDVSSKTR